MTSARGAIIKSEESLRADKIELLIELTRFLPERRAAAASSFLGSSQTQLQIPIAYQVKYRNIRRYKYKYVDERTSKKEWVYILRKDTAMSLLYSRRASIEATWPFNSPPIYKTLAYSPSIGRSTHH